MNDLREAPMVLPDALPGLNIRLGIKRLGSEALYVDLVRFLCSDKKDFVARITELVRNEEYAEARIMAHALKGSAATIAAESLCEAAKKLEFACVEEKIPSLSQLITEVETELCKIVESAKRLPEIELPPPPRRPPERSDISALFRRMEEMLEKSDPIETVSLAEQIREEVSSSAFSEEIRKGAELLNRQTGEYRFEEAAGTLGELKRLLRT